MIGAYFSCSKEFTSSNEVLDAYRRHFPNTTITMINDTKIDQYIVLSERYHSKYFIEDDFLGFPSEQFKYEDIVKWIKRFLYYTQFIDDDWILILNDDILVINNINSNDLSFDINCGNSISSFPISMLSIITQKSPEIGDKLSYGSVAGSIVRTSFFKKLSRNLNDVDKCLQSLRDNCDQEDLYSIDTILAFLTYSYGGTIGNYPGIEEFNSDNFLNLRSGENQVQILTEYKVLYGYQPQPYLEALDSSKYSIVLPTRGIGNAFELFIEYLLPRYFKYLDSDKIREFIVICPQANLEAVKQRICNNSRDFTFVFYTDEFIADSKTDGWMKQQVIKLAICSYVKTEHYFIIDDDLIITKPLLFSDFFDEKGLIYYSYESWPTNGPNFATNTSWWHSSLMISGLRSDLLINSTNLMGVTPQLMITRVVHQLLFSLGSNWIFRMTSSRSTEFSLYWSYLLKTGRTHYYIPSYKMFAVDNDVNILIQGLNRDNVVQRIQKGLNDRKYTFLVVQSWLNYPNDWTISALM